MVGLAPPPILPCLHLVRDEVQDEALIEQRLLEREPKDSEGEAADGCDSNVDEDDDATGTPLPQHIALLVESFHPGFDEHIQEILRSVAEPVSRPSMVHEYHITPFSLGTAIARGMTPGQVMLFLRRNTNTRQKEEFWQDSIDQATASGNDDAVGYLTEKLRIIRRMWTETEKFVQCFMDTFGKAIIVIENTHAADSVVSRDDLADVKVVYSKSEKLKKNKTSNRSRTALESSSIKTADETTCWVECGDLDVAKRLFNDRVITNLVRGKDIMQVSHSTHYVEQEGEDTSTHQGTKPHQDAASVFRFQLQDISAAKYVSQRAVTLGIPITQQYDFTRDRKLPQIGLSLRTSTKPRDYQKRAVESAAGLGRCSSGVVVLPCGAGKTLVGIMLMATVKKPAIVLCASSVSVEQWKNQILEYGGFSSMVNLDGDSSTDAGGSSALAVRAETAPLTMFGGRGRGAASRGGRGGRGAGSKALGNEGAKVPEPIACITGKHKDPITPFTQIVITTYTMLSIAHKMVEGLMADAAPAVGEETSSESDTSDESETATDSQGSQSEEEAPSPFRNPLQQHSFGVGMLTEDSLIALQAESSRELAQGGNQPTNGNVSNNVPPRVKSKKPSVAKRDDSIVIGGVKLSKAKESKFKLIKKPYGLMILDEVHVVPAEFFKDAMAAVDTKATVGLTATFVREDHKISHLFHLVGPKLYDVSWSELAARGFLATVTCTEVHCPLTGEFAVEYSNHSKQVESKKTKKSNATVGNDEDSSEKPKSRFGLGGVLATIAASNPTKFHCVRSLVKKHEGSKILIFCDSIVILKEHAAQLGCPLICGETTHKDRMKFFSDFQSTKLLNVLCVSRVGDVSVNLPNASVVIQVSSHGGSRRQEAQRLGRILRPKDRASDGSTVHAYFYSLVSNSTVEEDYGARRSRFLVDQGYTCRIAEHRMLNDSSKKVTNDSAKVGQDGPSSVPEGEKATSAAVAQRQDSQTKKEAPSAKVEPKRESALAVLGSTSSSRSFLHQRDRSGRGEQRLRQQDTAYLNVVKKDVDPSQLQWRVEWLAKIVSHWELENTAANEAGAKGRIRRGKRGRRGVNDGSEDSTSSSEETASSHGTDEARDPAVMMLPFGRTFNNSDTNGRAASVEIAGARTAAAVAGATTGGVTTEQTVAGVTYGSDDWIYHEF